jgi:transposase-like protein
MNWQEKLVMFGEITDDYPVCPHCGHAYTDTTELYESEDYVCDECGQEFHVEVDYTLTYTMTKGGTS